MHTIIVFIPLALLMVLALTTKRMAESMIAAALAAMVILHGTNFVSGTLDSFYETFTNSSLQFVILILVGFGGAIHLLQDSGALLGFGNLVSRFASGPKKPLLLTFFMAFLMFVEDYLSALTLTFSMKSVCDENRIPREHLAVLSVAVPTSLCLLIPFSSWIAFTVGLLKDFGLGFNDYVLSIRYMFYPMVIVIVMFLIVIGVIPKVGELKNAYDRVAAGGPTHLIEEKGQSLVDLEMDSDQKPSGAWNALIPIAVMVIGTLAYDNDVLHGVFLALFVEFALYIGQRMMTIPQFFDSFFEGAKGMTSLGIIVFFGFLLSDSNQKLGVFDIMIRGVTSAIPLQLLPLLTFLLIFFATFATAGCWTMQIIAVPIFIPIALGAGYPVHPIIAAMMSGVCMGYTACFYADGVFLCSAGTGVSNIRIVKTIMPYTILSGIISAVAFVVLGFMMA